MRNSCKKDNRSLLRAELVFCATIQSSSACFALNCTELTRTSEFSIEQRFVDTKPLYAQPDGTAQYANSGFHFLVGWGVPQYIFQNDLVNIWAHLIMTVLRNYVQFTCTWCHKRTRVYAISRYIHTCTYIVCVIISPLFLLPPLLVYLLLFDFITTCEFLLQLCAKQIM